MMAIETKRCPFCGGNADLHGWLGMDKEGNTVQGPECEDCGATAMSLADWEKRAEPVMPAKLRLPDEKPYDYSGGAYAYSENAHSYAWNRCIAKIKELNPGLEIVGAPATARRPPVVDTPSSDPEPVATVDPRDYKEDPTKGAGSRYPVGYDYNGDEDCQLSIGRRHSWEVYEAKPGVPAKAHCRRCGIARFNAVCRDHEGKGFPWHEWLPSGHGYSCRRCQAVKITRIS